jgi:cellulose synthase/poly-beta-1,6-N-acetylglucosamine synthase-like glycosyltransferase
VNHLLAAGYFFFTGYFILYCLAFLLQSMGTWVTIPRIRRLFFWQEEEILAGRASSLPRLSILVPAYNESKTIGPALHTMLASKYPDLEIVVVNDGSRDDTLRVLQTQFDLAEVAVRPRAVLTHQPVLAVYRSRIFPRILVVDKLNGGKADALNCALAYASGRLVCSVDADVLLPQYALLRAVLPHVEDPKVIATGGMIRLRNNCEVTPTRETVRLPKKFLEKIQVVEYMRSFTLGRAGWDIVNGEIIISGAFGVFRADLVRKIGGYQRFSVGEDMELVVRLHQHCRATRMPYKVLFVPDAVCWTEAPDNARDLFKQRSRWQQGLLSTLLIHKKMMFNPRYGAIGLLVLPYFLVFELLSPFVEVGGLVFTGACLAAGKLSPKHVALFFLVALATALSQSLRAIWINLKFFEAYRRVGDVFVLTLVAFLEACTYHFPMLWVKLRAVYDFFSKFHLRGGWVSPKRL